MDRRFTRGLVLPLGSCALLTGLAGAQTIRTTFVGTAQNDRLGVCVANAGDVNNDGTDDLLLGATEDGFIFDLREGYARVVSGADLSTLFTVDGLTPAGALGWSVAAAGHVNADAFGDIVVGAPNDGASQAGVVRVLSGATHAALWTFTGGSQDQLGKAVASAGDVNNDGRDDILVGAPSASPHGTSSGYARVYSGLTGGVLYTFQGAATGDRVGNSVAGLGDLNGDGYDDFIVGSIGRGATVYSGINGTPLFPAFTSVVTDDVYGSVVAGLGDVDGDGKPDFAIGATQDGSIFASAVGFVQIRSGANGALIRTLTGAATGDRFSSSIADAGDVNGDGRADVLVGADQTPLSFPGYVRVCSGMDGSTLHTFNGDVDADHFGQSVAGLGDLDGDGKLEFLVGASYASPGGSIKAGLARLWESSLTGSMGGGGGCNSGTTFCVMSPNSVGAGASMSMLGSTGVAANDLRLVSTGAPNGSIGLFFYGGSEVSVPFGNGMRCVGGSEVYRLGLAVAVGGVAQLDVDYDHTYGNGKIQPGQTWKFQHWFRDPAAGGAGFNLSNGLSLTFCP
jgi:FG-GAP repeat/FG-GAP-like repeat